MNLNLSCAELVVLAAHLDLEPTFAVGERTPEELERLKDEGWRSLLVRDLIRIEDDSVAVSTRLVSIATDVLAPLALVTHTQATGTDGQISHIMIGRSWMLSATPLVEDVAEYRSVSVDQVIDAVLAEAEASQDVPTVHRIEVVNGQERQAESELAWVRRTDGQVLVESDSGSREATAEELRTEVTRFLVDAAESLDPADR